MKHANERMLDHTFQLPPHLAAVFPDECDHQPVNQMILGLDLHCGKECTC
jgi:hypothetical protein